MIFKSKDGAEFSAGIICDGEYGVFQRRSGVNSTALVRGLVSQSAAENRLQELAKDNQWERVE